jgi:hypothetical protein
MPLKNLLIMRAKKTSQVREIEKINLPPCSLKHVSRKQIKLLKTHKRLTGGKSTQLLKKLPKKFIMKSLAMLLQQIQI